MSKRVVTILLLCVFGLLSVGCCPTAKLNLTVQLDDALRQKLASEGNRTMLVDIVAIGPAERQRWNDYSMTSYWTSGDPLRDSETSKVTLTFDPRDAKPQALSSSDPHWGPWMAGANDKDPPRLFILVQLPGAWQASKDDKAGNEDVRRLILPLAACRWDSTNVAVTVKESGITTVPSPKEYKVGQ